MRQGYSNLAQRPASLEDDEVLLGQVPVAACKGVKKPRPGIQRQSGRFSCRNSKKDRIKWAFPKSNPGAYPSVCWADTSSQVRYLSTPT